MPNRAQSELVGGILLLGVVVVTVGVAGAAVLNTTAATADEPRAEVVGDIGTDRITLSHQGGDSLPSDDLQLIVRVNGSETGLSWADGTLSGGDARFDPGEEWTVSRAYDADSVVAVTLGHRLSNAVLFDDETNPTTLRSVSGSGGKINAVDSDGEIEQGDVSAPTGTPTSIPGDGDKCEHGEWDDDHDEEDDECDDDHDEEDEGDDDHDEEDEGDDDDNESPGKSGSAPGQRGR